MVPVTAGRDLGWPYCDPDQDDNHPAGSLAGIPLVPDAATNPDGNKLDCAALAPVQVGLPAHSARILTYAPEPHWEQCEVLTLHATEQWHGAGTALIEAVGQLAARHGCARLWLITTNDNVDALRFYQRRGFCLAAVHRGAVDDSRSRLKPEIPVTGAYGIPLRDEIELDKRP